MQVKLNSKFFNNEMQKVSLEANREIDVLIYMDRSADGELCAHVRSLLMSNSPNVRVQIIYFDDNLPTVCESADFAIIVAGKNNKIVEFADQLKESGIAVFVCANSLDDIREAENYSNKKLQLGDYCVYDASVSKDIFSNRLGQWIAAVCPDKKIALPLAFSFVAKHMATDVVNATAVQNAGIGMAVFLRGADFPIMVANQLKMLFEIASMYGKTIDQSLLKEIAGVICCGFFGRKISRISSKVLPLPKMATSSLSAFVVTKTLGSALIEYFDAGGDASGIVAVVSKATKKGASAHAVSKRLANKFKNNSEMKKIYDF